MRRRHAILPAASPTKRRRISASQPEPPIVHALQAPLSGASGHATTSPALPAQRRLRIATQPHGAYAMSHVHLPHSSRPSATQQSSLIATPAALAPSALSTLCRRLGILLDLYMIRVDK